MKKQTMVLFLAALLCGCGREKAPTENAETFWVVTEQSCSDSFNLQAQIIAERMGEAQDNLTVQLDIFPTDARVREVAPGFLCK